MRSWPSPPGTHLPRCASAAEAAGLSGRPGIVSLGLPRPLLYDAWHVLGLPPLGLADRRHGGVDVVHAPSVAVPPRGRTPLVVTVHDVAPAQYPETFSRRGRRFHAQGLAAAARRADVVIAVSHAAADEIVAHSTIPDGRIRVIPNGVDMIEVTDAQRRRTIDRFGLGDAPYVLWVGSLEPRKGVGTLVAAMGRTGGSARLVLAGYPGWLSDGLIDPGDRDALGDRLRQLGQVDEVDLWALYAGATVFALPSRHEGFGLPVLEAMSQGTAGGVLRHPRAPGVRGRGRPVRARRRRGRVGRRARRPPRRRAGAQPHGRRRTGEESGFHLGSGRCGPPTRCTRR